MDALVLVHLAHRTSQRLAIVVNQSVRDHLHRPGHDLVQFVQRQANSVVGHPIFGKVVSANSLTAVPRTHQAFTLVGSALILLLAIVIV